MAHAQKPHFVFRAKRTSPFKSARLGRQFSRLLGARGVRISGSNAGSAVVMLDTPCSEVVRRVLSTHIIRQFPLHFPSLASPCAITFQLQSTSLLIINGRVHLNRSVGASVQSNAGSRGVRISGSNAGYTMFRGSVKGTGYPLHSPVSPSLPLPWLTVCHHISTGIYHTTIKENLPPHIPSISSDPRTLNSN
jgi:hypothetical protein